MLNTPLVSRFMLGGPCRCGQHVIKAKEEGIIMGRGGQHLEELYSMMLATYSLKAPPPPPPIPRSTPEKAYHWMKSSVLFVYMYITMYTCGNTDRQFINLMHP